MGNGLWYPNDGERRGRGGHHRSLCRHRRVGDIVCLSVALTGCAGSADTTGRDTDVPASSAVVCEDPAGDATALGRTTTPAVAAAADLEAVTLEAQSGALSVRFELAGAAETTTGTRQLNVNISPVEATYPAAEISVMQSAGDPGRLHLTVWPRHGDIVDGDSSEAALSVEGDAVVVAVPIRVLSPAVDTSWQWEATTTASAEGVLAQDACGSTDAGAGSRIVYFEAPTPTP